MSKVKLKKPKDNTMNFKQILAVAEAVAVGGADLEEVYWKKRLYNCITKDLYDEGYTFEENEIDEMIRRAYEKLCLYEGFPYEMNLSSRVLCKVLVVSYSQYCEDTKLFNVENILKSDEDINELYELYQEDTIVDTEEILNSISLEGRLGLYKQNDDYNDLESYGDNRMVIEDDYISPVEEVEKPKKRKIRRF